MILRSCFKTLFSIILIINYCNGQSNLEKGWENFNKNKRKEARASFSQALNDPDSKAEAYLALSILSTIEEKKEKAFIDFQNFFKSSDNPYPYLFSLWNTESVFSYESKRKEAQVNFLKSILIDPKANGTLKAMAHSTLGGHYEASNLPQKAKEEYEKIGSISDWQLVGTFENISESGFNKNYEPINHPEDSKEFINKDGAKVKWFTMKGNRVDKWIDFNYHFFSNNSIVYAQTFINSPVDQEIQMRIGTSGSLKTWVNDFMVYSEAEERNNDIDTYIFTVKLNKGFNRILLQIGSSVVKRANFMVRLTDENGHPIQNLKVSTKSQSYSKAQPYQPKIFKIFAEDFFENKLKQVPNNIFHNLILANTYLRNDKAYEARKALLTAQKQAPECSYIKSKLIEAYLRDDNETDIKITKEWIKDNDPDNIYSLNFTFNEELKKEEYEEAEKILNKIVQLYGENEETTSKRITIRSHEKKQDELFELIEQAYKKYPESYQFVELKLLLEQKVKKDFTAGINVIKKYLKNNYSVEAQNKLSDAYFAKSNIEAGIVAYADQLKYNPYDCGIAYRLGGFYFKIRDYANAERYYKSCIELAPYISYFWDDLGKTYEETKRSSQAIDAYKKAIELSPTNYDARNSLRKLMSKPDIYSYFERPDVYDIFKKSPKATSFPDDNSLILLDEVQKVVYAGGASEEKHFFLVKIFNAQGIEKWKEYMVDHNNMQSFIIEKAEVIKANGSKVEAEVNDDHIVFTTIEAGDAIHVTYKLKNYLTGKLAPHFWDRFYFSHWYPYKKSKYSLLISPEVKFKYQFSQNKIEPKITKADEFELYTWEKLDENSIKYEDRMPKLTDVANVLYLSSFPDWTYISNWYYDIASTKAKNDYEVNEVVATLLSDKKNISELEKAKIIYNYIVTNIKYSSVNFLQSGLIPQKASKVLNTKIGDCKDVSTLFVAMCKVAGLKAEWVLVHTRNRGFNSNILPSIEFNHCIAKLTADGKDYYIELTSDLLPFNTFYNTLKNAEALEVKSDLEKTSVQLIHLNPQTRSHNYVIRKTDMSIEGNDLKVRKQNIKTGVFGARMRETYRDIGQQEQFKEMQKAVTGEYNNVKLVDLKFEELNSTKDSVSYVFGYNASDAITEVGGMKLLFLPWSEKASAADFTIADNRVFPLDLWNITDADNEMETIVINIPSTVKLSEIPQSVSYSCSIADYKLNYKIEAGKITITRSFVYKKGFISMEELNAFKDFYKKVVTSDNKQLAFK